MRAAHSSNCASPVPKDNEVRSFKQEIIPVKNLEVRLDMFWQYCFYYYPLSLSTDNYFYAPVVFENLSWPSSPQDAPLRSVAVLSQMAW